jgi:hypothetical protein
MARPKTNPIDRFNTKYVVDEETNCWNWTAGKFSTGYGQFSDNNRKPCKAHRFAYEYFVGPLKEGLVCCHICNNRSCVNPNHLRLDSQSSNCIDMLKIKKHNKQILSYEEVAQIKNELKNYYRGQIKDLAHFYKVDPDTISQIKRGKRWSHINIS